MSEKYRYLDMSNLTRRPIHSPKTPSKSTTSDEDELDTSTKSSRSESKSPRKNEIYPNMETESDSDDEVNSSVKSVTSVSDDSCIKISPKKILNTNEQKGNLKSNIYLWIFVVFICCCFLAVYYFSLPQNKLPERVLISVSSDQVVKELKENFNNQHSLSLKIIKKSLEKVLDNGGNFKTPSVILLMSFNDGETTADCFARTLAKFVNRNKDFVHIKGEHFSGQEPSKIKEDIDTNLNKSALVDQLNVFLIQNIDFIPGKAAPIFYKYCDEDTAVFKNAVIILTISGKDNVLDHYDLKGMNRIARQRLSESWKDLSADEFDPLYNRIAASLSGIVNEPTFSQCFF